MPKVAPLQSNFSGGEFSPHLVGRVDSDRYKSSLKTCLNYIPTVQGDLIRRPGTAFVFPTKDNGVVRLLSFEFSTTQAYMIEFGNGYFRFFKDYGIITNTPVNISNVTQANPAVVTANAHGFSNGDRVTINGVLGMTQLDNREFVVAGATANTFELSGVDSSGYDAYTSGGTAAEIYEIVSPYGTADLFQIKYTQSADVLYLTHPDYPPKKLQRFAHNNWTITDIDLLDGPYFALNKTTTTLTPSATTGTITVTASAVAGINDGQGFLATDVGRLIRFKNGSTWGYAKITVVNSTTSVDADVKSALGAAAATDNWRIGLYSETTGYPAAVMFHEDRLFFAGSPGAPQRIDGSKSGDYENFAPTATDGTVAADNAVGFNFNANDVNANRWLASDEKALLAGTVAGEWTTRPSQQSEALSPTNIAAKRATTEGSEDIQPIQSGKATLFIQRGGKIVREMNYYYDVDGYRSTNLTELADHITSSGIRQMAYQKIPQPLVWCVRNDGVLATLTYSRDLDNLRAGWHRHIIGGYSDSAQSDAIVESVASLISVDQTRQEMWIVVQRKINGGIKRYIEYITKIFEDEDEQRDAFFVDSGLTFDNPKTISAATQASPVVVTANGHGMSNGDKFLITGIKGMEELNGQTFIAAGVTANTVNLTAVEGGGNVDGTGFSPYVSGGELRKLVSTISGINHLEGESVSILADGAVQPNKTVTNGKITLSIPAGTVTMGFGYNSDAEMLRLEAGAADGTALGKTRRTHLVGMLLHRTLGMKLGSAFTKLDTVVFRKTSDPMTRAPGLFTGIISKSVAFNYDFENHICWRQDQPLPGRILAVMPQLVEYDN